MSIRNHTDASMRIQLGKAACWIMEMTNENGEFAIRDNRYLETEEKELIEKRLYLLQKWDVVTSPIICKGKTLQGKLTEKGLLIRKIILCQTNI